MTLRHGVLLCPFELVKMGVRNCLYLFIIYLFTGQLLQNNTVMLDELCCHNSPCADSSHNILINHVYEHFTSFLRNANLCTLKIIRSGACKPKLIWSRNLCILKANSKKALHCWWKDGFPLSGDLYAAK